MRAQASNSIRDRVALAQVLENLPELRRAPRSNKPLDLRFIDLHGANLWGADLRGADLFRASLRGANLRGANLLAADLRGADLAGADLEDALLPGADLSRANLESAVLRKAVLSRANLSGARLHKADLREANLGEANLQEAILSLANFTDACLKGALFTRKHDLPGDHSESNRPTAILELSVNPLLTSEDLSNLLLSVDHLHFNMLGSEVEIEYVRLGTRLQPRESGESIDGASGGEIALTGLQTGIESLARELQVAQNGSRWSPSRIVPRALLEQFAHRQRIASEIVSKVLNLYAQAGWGANELRDMLLRRDRRITASCQNLGLLLKLIETGGVVAVRVQNGRRGKNTRG